MKGSRVVAGGDSVSGFREGGPVSCHSKLSRGKPARMPPRRDQVMRFAAVDGDYGLGPLAGWTVGITVDVVLVPYADASDSAAGDS